MAKEKPKDKKSKKSWQTRNDARAAKQAAFKTVAK